MFLDIESIDIGMRINLDSRCPSCQLDMSRHRIYVALFPDGNSWGKGETWGADNGGCDVFWGERHLEGLCFFGGGVEC